MILFFFIYTVLSNFIFDAGGKPVTDIGYERAKLLRDTGKPAMRVH